MLQEDQLRDVPLLIFANKQDLPHAMNPFEIAVKFGLREATIRTDRDEEEENQKSRYLGRWYGYGDCVELGKTLRGQKRKWRIQPSCACNGEGLYEGWDWLAQMLQETQK